MLAALRILIKNGSRKTKGRQRPIGQTVCELTKTCDQNTKYVTLSVSVTTQRNSSNCNSNVAMFCFTYITLITKTLFHLLSEVS